MPSASAPSVPGRHAIHSSAVGAGLRHARFHLHEFCPASGPALAHLSVTDRLRHRGVPGAEEIGAEGDDIVGAAQIERRQRGVAKAEQICLAQHCFVERLVPDCRRRAVSFQEALDQFVALAAQRARQKGQRRSWTSTLAAPPGAAATSLSASSQVICWNSPEPRGPVRLMGCVMRSGW